MKKSTNKLRRRAYPFGGQVGLALAQQAPNVLDTLIGALEGGGNNKYSKEPLVNAAAMRGMVSPYAYGGEADGEEMAPEQLAELQAMAEENGVTVEEMMQMLQEQQDAAMSEEQAATNPYGEDMSLDEMQEEEMMQEEEGMTDEGITEEEAAMQQAALEQAQGEQEEETGGIFKYGGIHIKKANRGKFTASAKKAGMGVQAYAKKVLASPNASATQKKRANFARNAAKWKHAYGGYAGPDDPVIDPRFAMMNKPVVDSFKEYFPMPVGASPATTRRLARTTLAPVSDTVRALNEYRALEGKSPLPADYKPGGVETFTPEGKEMLDEIYRIKQENFKNLPIDQQMRRQYNRKFNEKYMAYGGRADAAIEVEGKEAIETPDGRVGKVRGPSHGDGGVDLDVPSGTKIFSDRIKIDGKTMAQRKLSRERQMTKLDKLAKANPFDKLLQGTIQRTAEVTEMEDQKDMAIQKIASANMAAPEPEEVVAEDMGQGFAYGGRVRPRYQFGNVVDPRFAYDTSTLPIRGAAGINPMMFPRDAMSGSPTFSPVPNTPVSTDYAGYMNNWLRDTATPTPTRLDKLALRQRGVTRMPAAAPKDFSFDTSRAVKGIPRRTGMEMVYTPPAEEPSRPGDLTLGDYVGMGSSAFGAISGVMNTRANARGNRPNVNRWQGFGREAIEDNMKAQDIASGLRTSALTDIDTSSQAARNRIRNSAQSVNTVRAMDTITEAGANKARGTATDAFTRQMMGLLGQKSQLENIQDTRVMMGEDKRDLEDKGDRDNYYSNMARNLADISTTGQAMGRNLNISRSNMVDAELLGQQSEFFEYDNRGRLINKRKRT